MSNSEYASVLFFPKITSSSSNSSPLSSPQTPTSQPQTLSSTEHSAVLINSKKYNRNDKVQFSPSKRSSLLKRNSFCVGVFLGVVLVCLVSYLLYTFYYNTQKCSPERFLIKKPHENLTTKTSKVCTSASCKASGESIYKAADFCLDPCEDFYAYACNGWIRENPVPEDSGALGISSFTFLSDKVDLQLKELLKKSSTNQTSAKSVSLARELYHECLDVKARSREDFVALNRELKSIFGAEWPIINGSFLEGGDEEEGVFKETSQKILLETLMRFTQIESTPLVDFFIDTDVNDTSKSIFYFTVPDGFDKDRIVYSDRKSYSEGLKVYQNSVVNMTMSFIKKQVESANLTFDFEDEYKKIKKSITDVLILENDLVLSTTAAEDLSDPKDGYNRMTLKEFNVLTNGSFNWTLFPALFVDKFDLQSGQSFNANITEDTEVVVTDLEYFRKLPGILAATPLHVIYNYLGIKFLYYFRNRTSSQAELEEWCLGLVTENLDLAVSRLYVEEHVPPGAKKEAEEMISEVRKSFRSLLKTEASVWLDNETQILALEKEKATKYETAYADFILDDRKLDEHYGLLETETSGLKSLQIIPGQFFESVLDLRRHRMITFSRKMNYMIRNNKVGASNINAFANKYKNEIMLPAAMLQPPFFDVGRPDYLNTASMGSIIGHEITHHFDSEGRAFTAEGRMINWWSAETEVHFEAASKCFAEQYSEIIDEETGRQLNGNATLAENIADNGGIRTAWRAFKSSNEGGNSGKEFEVVPKMETFTPEQLFFIVYAQTWCAAYRNNASLAYVIDTDEHVPEPYRVNLPLANFAPFSETFSCPIGSRMNLPPEKRCMLW